MLTPIDVVELKCRKIIRTGNRRNLALFTRQKKTKFLAPSQTVASARIVLKVCQGQPQQTFGSKCSKFYPNGLLSAEL